MTATAQSNDPRTIRKGEISILIATRARPELLSEVLLSLKANTARKDLVSLWLYVDDDDEVTLGARREGRLPDPGFPVHWHIGPRPAGLGETHQALWSATGGASQIYMTSVDDARYSTTGWDEIVRQKFDEYPDGVLLAFPHDPMTADQATYPILGWNWIRTLGKIYPGYFPYWGDDKWVDQIGRMAGRIAKLPINLDPVGGKGKTKRMRNHAFWMRYFQLTLPEREQCALKLLEVIHAGQPELLQQAQRKMQEVAAVFRKEKEQFSDIYCVFQEERFTEVTPEQRARFDAKSFQAESVAVSRLVSLAQNALNEGHPDEAIECLDATKYSDIRLRYAQLLLADALRIKGKIAEADAVAAEVLRVWPQMDPLRRAFRFLGMVANDGKRMLVGLTSKGKKG